MKSLDELRAAFAALRAEYGDSPTPEQITELTDLANSIAEMASTPAEAPAEAETPVEETIVAAAAASPEGAPVNSAPFVAAADVNGHAAGAGMDFSAVAKAVVRKVDAIKGSRGGARQQYQIAQIQKTFDPRAIVGDYDNGKDAIKFATDERNLPNGSLVAAGGWCTPSEVWFDLLNLSSRDGLLSIPEVNLSRGGVRLIPGGGPQFAQVFADTGFCFTEAQDIAGGYSLTNADVALVEGGAGLTSFTITVNGQTTAAIDDDATPATVQAAIVALSNVGPGDVVVTGTSAPVNMRARFQGDLAGDVVTVTTTPTGGSGVVTVTYIQAGGVNSGPKGCYTVECPEWTDYRLEVCGLCIQAGILQNKAFPELTQDLIEKALIAHAHRIDSNIIADIVAGSTAVSLAGSVPDASAAAPILNAVELQALDIRAKYRMSDSMTIEAKFPAWTKGLIRADLAYRNGVDLIDVSDERIMGWFAQRNISVQFLANLDPIGAVNPAVAYPATTSFLMYPAGTWVKGASDIIDLGVLYVPADLQYNNYQALFTEEGYNTLPVGPESRVVELPVCPSGVTGANSLSCES